MRKLRDGNAPGFTLVEVLVATVVLGVGIVALVGASASVSRLVGHGRKATHAAERAERRLELLRQAAAAVGCVGLAGGAAPAAGDVDERWEVGGGGSTRLVRVLVTYPGLGGPHTDTVSTLLRCG